MAAWDRVEREINALGTPDAQDVIRRQKIDVLAKLTGRPVIVYASDFLTDNQLKRQVATSSTLITLGDLDGFNEVTANLPGPSVDILVQSPGGVPEAAESIVNVLRSRYSDIRFIISGIAKSAATMLAMSGNAILMDDTSELGPIDPQMVMVRDRQNIVAPAYAIQQQFLMAQEEIKADPGKLPSWLPILQQYGPALLKQCEYYTRLSERLVKTWLAAYMFHGQPDAEEKADHVAAYLNNHGEHLSHGRRIGLNELLSLPEQLNVIDIRTQPDLHRAVRELHAAIAITFVRTGAIKLFENSQGGSLIQQLQPVMINQQPPTPQQLPQPKRVERGKPK